MSRTLLLKINCKQKYHQIPDSVDQSVFALFGPVRNTSPTRFLPYRVFGSDFPAKTLLPVQIELIDLGAYIPSTKYFCTKCKVSWYRDVVPYKGFFCRRY